MEYKKGIGEMSSHEEIFGKRTYSGEVLMTLDEQHELYFENMQWATSHVVEIKTVFLLDRFKSLVESYHKHFAPINYLGALDPFCLAYGKHLAELRTIPVDTSKPQA